MKKEMDNAYINDFDFDNIYKEEDKDFYELDDIDFSFFDDQDIDQEEDSGDDEFVWGDLGDDSFDLGITDDEILEDGDHNHNRHDALGWESSFDTLEKEDNIGNGFEDFKLPDLE